MNEFAWALAGFVLIHVGISATGMRTTLVRAIGEWPYRALFSLASLALLVWLIGAFNDMRANPFDPLNEPMWTPPDWLRWPANVLTALGLILIAAGLFTPGPTLAGYEKRGLAAAEPAHGVLRITRHPFLWGVALWAAGHLLGNGERFALMLFGALGVMAIFGARSIDRKVRARDPEAWARFEAVTSSVPFVAIARGQNTLKLGEIGWRLIVAIVLVGLIAWAHPMFTGRPIV